MTTANAKRAAAMTASDGSCKICGRDAMRPRIVVREGRIDECCVSAAHDPYIVKPSNHATFVARARKAGLDGVA